MALPISFPVILLREIEPGTKGCAVCQSVVGEERVDAGIGALCSHRHYSSSVPCGYPARRSSFLSILPTLVLGNSSINSTSFGTL